MNLVQRFKNLTLIAIFASLCSYQAIAAPATALYYTSSASSWVGHGATVLATPGNGFSFQAYHGASNQVSFFINDWATNPNFGSSSNWWLDFAAPANQHLSIGHYNATRWPFQLPQNAGLNFSGNGRGNNTLTGFFDILEATFDSQGTVKTFAADFVQYDEGFHDWWNKGSIRYNSEIPIAAAVPEPDTYAILLVGLGLIVNIARRKQKN